MRLCGAAIFLLLTAWTVCGTELPEVVARCGGTVIRREEAVKLLRQAALSDRNRLSRRELLKKVLTDHFCSEALSKMLSEAGFSPDAEKTLTLLKKSRDAMPVNPDLPDDGTLFRLSRDPKVQLKWAFRQYLEARRPDMFQVPAAVVERYYRENQQLFRMPPQMEGVRYRARDAAVLDTLILRVRQGESAAAAAQSIAGVQAEPVRGYDAVFAELQPGQWSRVTEIPGGGFAVVCMLKRSPPGYVPLTKAAPEIREMMIRRRAALELEGALKSALDAAKMEFYF